MAAEKSNLNSAIPCSLRLLSTDFSNLLNQPLKIDSNIPFCTLFHIRTLGLYDRIKTINKGALKCQQTHAIRFRRLKLI